MEGLQHLVLIIGLGQASANIQGRKVIRVFFLAAPASLLPPFDQEAFP
jgi:hypothetical protein